LGYVGIAIAFAYVGAELIQHGPLVVVIIGLAALTGFGLLLGYFILLVARPPVLMEISDVGLRIPTGRGRRLDQVPWDAIAGMKIFRLTPSVVRRGLRTLGVVASDPSAPIWDRARRRPSDGVSWFLLGFYVDLELEQIVELMRRYRAQLPLEYGPLKPVGIRWLRSLIRKRQA
jgi:hypothetical protein